MIYVQRHYAITITILWNYMIGNWLCRHCPLAQGFPNRDVLRRNRSHIDTTHDSRLYDPRRSLRRYDPGRLYRYYQEKLALGCSMSPFPFINCWSDGGGAHGRLFSQRLCTVDLRRELNCIICKGLQVPVHVFDVPQQSNYLGN